MFYLLYDFTLALNQKVRLVNLKCLEPGAIVLDKIQQERCYLGSILVGVGCGLAIGQVATFGGLLFLEMNANSKRETLIRLEI